MNRLNAFSSRNFRELLRDPLSIVFGVGLPIFLLVMMWGIGRSVGEMPVEVFSLNQFTPGIAMFSYTFLAMFGAMLLAGDRGSSFLSRLFAGPLLPRDYIVGYSLPLLAIALIQGALTFATALLLGLTPSWHILAALAALLPCALLFVGLGLLLGCLLTYKQVGGVASILVQVAALSSGMWFDLNQIGGVFKAIGYALPFAHALDATRAALAGDWAAIWLHEGVVLLYAVAALIAAVLVFRKKMKG